MREEHDCVHVAVTDPGDGFERPASVKPDLSKTGGLGLVPVDRMARRWGTHRAGGGSVVWFELPYDRG